MTFPEFPAPVDSDALSAFRAEVRAFARREAPPQKSYAYLGGASEDFSRKLAARGWIGMCWPQAYGGSGRSMLERSVFAEEMLAARAPLAFHWIGDRQAGPLLLKYGTEAQRQLILPRIAAAQVRFCIGMSEPDSGSDLASVRTTAEPVEGGFRLNGTKLWSSNAHESDYMIILCRTSARSEARHEGLSQLLVDLRQPGIECRRIEDMAGEREFNEVVFKDVFIPARMLVGQEGQGWEQVGSELAYERSGPERFMSSYGLLVELIDLLGRQPGERQAIAAGRLVAHLATVRRLSRSVAAMLHAGGVPAVQAAMVKDLGTNLEQEIGDVVRGLMATEPDITADGKFAASLAQIMIRAPSFTLRGGTREVLRGIIARGIGVR